jgi:vanillate O-demethylase monooxygenase subunit
MSALGSYPAESRMSYRTLVNADCQLIVDNLLDATHADFVHAGMLGNGAFTRVKPAVTVRGNTVFAEWVNRRTIAVPQLTPFLQDPNPDNLESWIVIRWNAPGVVRLEFGTSRLGGNREDGPRVVAYHIMMPREDGTSNYEVAAVRNYGYEDPVISSRINQSVAFAFEQQDKPIIEAQQRMMGGLDFWDLKPLLLRADGAAVQARRKLKAMIEAETAPSRPEQTAGAPSPVEVASR